MIVAGAVNGAMTFAKCLGDGRRAALETINELGFKAVKMTEPKADDETFAISPLWQVSGCKNIAFVDFQNDVTSADIALSVREGYTSVEHLKRYTTLGMATDQEKLPAPPGLPFWPTPPPAR